MRYLLCCAALFLVPLILHAQDATVSTLMRDLSRADAMAVDHKGNIYMAGYVGPGSRALRPIMKISPEGTVSTFVTDLKPHGFNFDPQGRDLYMVEGPDHQKRILRIKPDGTLEVVTSSPLIRDGSDIVVTPEGTLFVSDIDNNKLYKITPDGNVTLFAEGPMFNRVLSLAYDADSGNLYAANWADGRIHRINKKGEVSLLATVPGNNKNVVGWMVLVEDHLYATNFDGHQVYKVSLTGEVHVFAGTGERGFRDGLANQATFFHPNGLAFSPSDNALYLSDWRNDAGQTIRKIILPR